MIRTLLFFYLPQALLIIHVVKTGRSIAWIFVLIFVPIAGGIAYLIVEVLPDLFNSRQYKRQADFVNRIVRPGASLHKQEEAARYSPTFQNLVALANAYVENGRYEDAVNTFRRALKPPFEDDLDTLYNLAFAQYMGADFNGADTTMKRIGELGRGRFNARETLLHAKIREGLGDIEGATRLYANAAEKSPDLDYQFYYGQYLRRSARPDEALKQYQGILDRMEHIPRSLRKQYRTMLSNLRKEMDELRSGR
jgi:hypothetical protein